jgi:hypothetical protein
MSSWQWVVPLQIDTAHHRNLSAQESSTRRVGDGGWAADPHIDRLLGEVSVVSR